MRGTGQLVIGWNAGALWEDTKFAIKHFSDIERIAMVGETKWQHSMATFCKPFTKATSRYFDHAEAAEALGCSVNAVGIRVHRAKERLRALLGADSQADRPVPAVIKPNGVTDGS